MRRVRPALHPLQPTPRVPSLSIERHLRLREDQAEEVETVRRLPTARGRHNGAWRTCSAATLSPSRTAITATASVMTTDRRISSYGPDRNQPASVHVTRWIGAARSSNSTPTFSKASKPYACAAGYLVEVKGFEPLSPGDRLGLLRAEPMHR